jgi:thioredoxin reductase
VKIENPDVLIIGAGAAGAAAAWSLSQTKLKIVLSPIYNINNKERLVFTLKSLDIDVYVVRYDTEKIKDYCTRIRHRLPEFHLKSFYFDEPKLYKGQKKVIDINYYGSGSNVMVFYDHIDLKYLEELSIKFINEVEQEDV